MKEITIIAECTQIEGSYNVFDFNFTYKGKQYLSVKSKGSRLVKGKVYSLTGSITSVESDCLHVDQIRAKVL